MRRTYLLRLLPARRAQTFLLVALACGAPAPAAENSGAPASNDLRIPPVSDPNVVGVIRPPALVIASPRESIINEPESAEWCTDYPAALRQAARENKRVLLNFTGSDWCRWCKRMEADVLSKPEFKAYAAKRLILVKLDFPRMRRLPPAEAAQNDRLKQQFGVRGFPTFVTVNASGVRLGQITGYVNGGPRAFIAALERQMGR